MNRSIAVLAAALGLALAGGTAAVPASAATVQQGVQGYTAVAGGHTGTDAGGRLASVQFWDAERGLPEGPPLRTSDPGLDRLTFSPDGRTLLAVSGPHQVYQGRPGWAARWDVGRKEFLGKSLGHNQVVTGATWTPDGSRFLTTSWEPAVRVWRADGTPVVTIPHPVNRPLIAPTPDGRCWRPSNASVGSTCWSTTSVARWADTTIRSPATTRASSARSP